MAFFQSDDERDLYTSSTAIMNCPKCHAFINLKYSNNCPNCDYIYIKPRSSGGASAAMPKKIQPAVNNEPKKAMPPCPACGIESLAVVPKGIKCGTCKMGFVKVNGKWYKTMNL